MMDFTALAAGAGSLCDRHFRGEGLIKSHRADEVSGGHLFDGHPGTLCDAGDHVIVMPGVTVGEGPVAGRAPSSLATLEPWGIMLDRRQRKWACGRRTECLLMLQRS